MRNFSINLTSILLAIFMLSAPMSVSAESYRDFELDKISGAEMAGDLVLVRPMMLVATLAGTAVFVASLPFSLLGGNVGDAGKTLVVEPAKYTFIRPLGDIRQN